MKIPSFEVNHLTLDKGLYVSRVDGNILTLDLRMRKPYCDKVLTAVQMHSLEHLLAHSLRNGENKDKVLYVGPMGCATGFYVLYKGLGEFKAVPDIINSFKNILDMNEMPGNSKIECGDCTTLDLEVGKNLAKEYLEIIKNKNQVDKYNP